MSPGKIHYVKFLNNFSKDIGGKYKGQGEETRNFLYFNLFLIFHIDTP